MTVGVLLQESCRADAVLSPTYCKDANIGSNCLQDLCWYVILFLYFACSSSANGVKNLTGNWPYTSRRMYGCHTFPCVLLSPAHAAMVSGLCIQILQALIKHSMEASTPASTGASVKAFRLWQWQGASQLSGSPHATQKCAPLTSLADPVISCFWCVLFVFCMLSLTFLEHQMHCQTQSAWLSVKAAWHKMHADALVFCCRPAHCVPTQ